MKQKRTYKQYPKEFKEDVISQTTNVEIARFQPNSRRSQIPLYDANWANTHSL